jgi:hypothetical protein
MESNNTRSSQEVNMIMTRRPLQRRSSSSPPHYYFLIFAGAYMASSVLFSTSMNMRQLHLANLLLYNSSSSNDHENNGNLTLPQPIVSNTTTTANTYLKNYTNHSTTSQRPTLLLHMGPPKTASSYLQCILTNMMDTYLALDNYVFLGAHFKKCQKPQQQQVDADNNNNNNSDSTSTSTTLLPRRRRDDEQPALIQDCYDIFTRPRRAEFNPKFLHDLRQAHRQGKNVIIMNECFLYFTTAQRRIILDEFSTKKWNVQMVLNYRRAFEFLPSYYNQGAKPKKEHGWQALYLWPGEASPDDPNNNHDVGLELRPFDIENRGHVTQVFRDMETKGSSFVEQLRHLYGEAFPDMHVIKLHEMVHRDRHSKNGGGDAVLQELFCRIAGKDSMPHSCAAVQLDETIQIGDLERNPYYSFNYDMLGTAAYAKQLLGFQKKKNTNNATTTTTKYLREDVTWRIQQHQEEDLKLTHHDFDTICLAQDKMDRLLNASIHSEKVIYGADWTRQHEVEHRRAFVTFQEKKPYTFCWINVERTLQDPTWLAFFASLV